MVAFISAHFYFSASARALERSFFLSTPLHWNRRHRSSCNRTLGESGPEVAERTEPSFAVQNRKAKMTLRQPTEGKVGITEKDKRQRELMAGETTE